MTGPVPAQRPAMHRDAEACYRAVKSRDRRFDGVFYTAVATTGIYCRPSCPARTPAMTNVTFHPTAAAAQQAGYRACKRCLPDATPGSPEWDVAADVAGRAMRLIADGVVERDGVEGLAERLGYSSRQVQRIVTESWGAGPLALARARRAQTARTLIETTELALTDVAFAAGFSSVRQFNDTMREVYATTPTDLRGRRGCATSAGHVHTRIGVREPFDGQRLLAFLALRAVEGVEAVADGCYHRTLRLPHGHGVVRIELVDRPEGLVPCRFTLQDPRDLAPALERTRRLLDADSDPVAVADVLAGDPALAASVARRPGLRVPGHVDGAEVAVRAVLGQQVSVASARGSAARLVREHGSELGFAAEGPVDRVFPDAVTIAGLDPQLLSMPRVRGRALVALSTAIAEGRVSLDRSVDPADVRAALLALPGIGPWTADYIAIRALGVADAFLPTDLGVRHGALALGLEAQQLVARSERWRPWRSYALMHFWSAASEPQTTSEPQTSEQQRISKET